MLTVIGILFASFLAMFGSVQFGGNRMGGVALPASGDVVQNFQNMPRGPIDQLFLHLTVTGKSSAGAFAAKVDTGSSASAEGTDDIDLLLAGIFTSMTLFWEPENLCAQLSFPQWRTILGNFNKRDFGGTLVNGLSLTATGGANTAYHIEIPIPVSLRKYFFDGAMTTNGSERLKNGQLTFSIKASTGSVALTNGTFVVSSVSEEIKVHHGAGDAGDIGPSWRCNRTLGYATTYELPPCSGGRLFLADILPLGSATATNITIDDFTNMTPLDFVTEYQATKLILGGYDVTARCTPYIYLPDDARFDDLTSHVNKPIRWDMIGPTSVGIYDVQMIAASGTAFHNVATSVGGGGQVSEQNPSVASLGVGSVIHPALAALAPKRIRPMGAPGVARATPAFAAANGDIRKTAAGSSKATMLGKFLKKNR